MQFIFANAGQVGSVHDSTIWKSTSLYRQRSELFSPEAYLLADKAYSLDRYVITPYKEPIARQQSYKRFNIIHSRARVNIEHAFGILKARWQTLLHGLPLYIRNAKKDHLCATHWMLSSIVLHNMLISLSEDNQWLEEDVQQSSRMTPKTRLIQKSQVHKTLEKHYEIYFVYGWRTESVTRDASLTLLIL